MTLSDRASTRGGADQRLRLPDLWAAAPDALLP